MTWKMRIEEIFLSFFFLALLLPAHGGSNCLLAQLLLLCKDTSFGELCSQRSTHAAKVLWRDVHAFCLGGLTFTSVGFLAWTFSPRP